MNVEICLNKESMEEKSAKSKPVLHAVRFYKVIFLILFIYAVYFREISKSNADSAFATWSQWPILIAPFLFMLVLFGKRLFLMGSKKMVSRTKKSRDKFVGFGPMPHQLN